jgi:hypothetical protein
MKHYELQSNEVILYRGNVNLLPDGKPTKSNRFKKEEIYLILTNLHIIVDKITQKFLSKEVNTILYDTQTVKKYNDTPQIIQKGAFVDVYLLGEELFFQFPNKQQATQFNNAALRLLTGQSKFVRGVKKGQKAIKETEESLNIDITGTAKAAASVAAEMAASAQGKKVNTIGTFAKKLFEKKKEKQLPPPEEKEEN